MPITGTSPSRTRPVVIDVMRWEVDGPWLEGGCTHNNTPQATISGRTNTSNHSLREPLTDRPKTNNWNRCVESMAVITGTATYEIPRIVWTRKCLIIGAKHTTLLRHSHTSLSRCDRSVNQSASAWHVHPHCCRAGWKSARAVDSCCAYCRRVRGLNGHGDLGIQRNIRALNNDGNRIVLLRGVLRLHRFL